MSKTKIGIIGCGTIANDAHIPAYLRNEEVEIKYFCDIIENKAVKCVEKYGCGIAVVDYRDVLNDPEVDAVSVCTPNLMHSVISCDAMRAGKHVLCEKPAARIYSEAEEMLKVCRETGKTLNIGVVNRFNGAVNEIRRIVQAGELGDIYHVYVSFRAQRSIPGLGGAFTTKSIAGGGVLIDWGVHYLDIVMYVLDDPKPISVSGKAYSKLGCDMPNYVYERMWAEDTKDLNGTYDVDDFVTAFARTEGPTITLNGAWAQNLDNMEGKATFIEFLGDKGGIRLTYGGDFTVFTTKDGKLYSYNPEFSKHAMFDNEINSFVRCIQTGEKLPSHIERVIITAKLMQAIYDSSDSGKEIVLE